MTQTRWAQSDGYPDGISLELGGHKFYLKRRESTRDVQSRLFVNRDDTFMWITAATICMEPSATAAEVQHINE